ANPRPTKTGGGFAFGSVTKDLRGTGSIRDLGGLLLSVNEADNLSRFALATTQKLCFYANSSACDETDPEFRRVAQAFQARDYSFPVLIKELFASPLVTSAAPTKTSEALGVTVSIARRDQFCQALSGRLGKPDICALSVPLPASAQKNILNIAGNIPADAFGRGSESPVTPTDPTLFFRAASEMLCEDVATQVVEPSAGSGVFSTSDVPGSIAKMVELVMGYPPADPKNAEAAAILKAHYDAAVAQKANATNALRSTFVAACQSPTSVSFGL
ncbi:MAG TPA: hypothetical protein VFQ61_13725, partial [Polyangiaceae bacterium]|nr:hypothetical protein [Polyangiaceae bacterium]